MLKGNKGEWSEIYTLLRLLADKEIHVGDKELNRVPDLLYPIIRIIRDETNGKFEYKVGDEIEIIQNDEVLLKIGVNEFKEKADLLLKEIKNSEKTFEVPKIESFLSQIKCSNLKAKSSVKTDIKIVIHDLETNYQPELGFSIKSQLGNPSTLLNAGKTTNFIFKTDVLLADSEIEKINLIGGREKIKYRLIALKNQNININYFDLSNDIFKNNLVLVDSLMPEIMSEMVKCFYSTKYSKLSDLSDELTKNNPLNFDLNHNHGFYDYKLKKFLTDVAVGMMPSKVWNGVYDATGGYLIVKENGEVLAYHLFNRNEFEDYLFLNTKLETASTTRHDFGQLYKKDNECFINLNLQIRFLK